MPMRDLLITGDCGMERYVYIESLPKKPANLREAWVDALEFRSVEMPGGAGQLARYLGGDYVPDLPAASVTDRPESLYLLTNQAAEGESPKRWKVALAIVAGQRAMPYPEIELKDFPEATPVVLVDFRQGWLSANYDILPELLSQRPYLIRTHDPVNPWGADASLPDDIWQDVRNVSGGQGIWFSPYQDIAEGALRVAGNWETTRDNILRYLKEDPSLWDEQIKQWTEHVVIQISYDGALVISPGCQAGEETIIAFPGDQPGSFNKHRHGTVIGGGVLICATLAQLLQREQFSHEDLVAKAGQGLSKARNLVIQGYAENPDPSTDTVYPKPTVADTTVSTNDAPVVYSPPADSLQTAFHIITANEQAFKRDIVYSVGKLFTCDPVFAEQLIRLEGRIQSHVASTGGEVLSVAVFGGPGSGKSFAVEQVQQSIGGELAEMAFNVSQFDSPQRLVSTLTEVQTVSLRDKVPFVQWDEFDCLYEGDRGGWLGKFLMPMQDAAFWDGDNRRVLGKCVFVFVGGTWNDKADFENWVQTDGQNLKGRDFQSRLDRILEVPSVDVPAERATSAGGCPRLNRAIIIRLHLRGKSLISIDRNVAEFLLTAPLKHGARSLKTIIDASDLSRTKRFCDYHLPPDEVMEVHVVNWREHLPPQGTLLELK